MKTSIHSFTLIAFTTVVLTSFTTQKVKAESTLTKYGAIAKAESLIPLRPGIPGKSPFWNGSAHQFIYAPAFDYKPIAGAVNYLYKITCEDKTTHHFSNKVPYAALSEAWKTMPTGFFELRVIAQDKSGDSIGLAGSGKYYKAAFFNGPYHQPVMPYDKSAEIALNNLLHKDYVEYWITNKVPDPDYQYYRYPAKIYSALIVGAVTHARLKPNTPDAERSIQLARIVADYLIGISFREGSVWEFFPPTYYGPRIKNNPGSHMNLTTNFTIMGADAGNAYLDLYDYTGEVKYLDAAKRIAATYLKNQMDKGSWYLFVNYETGAPLAENIVIPTAPVNYFIRLKKDYKVEGLEQMTEKAMNWIMENPVKTFNWQGQFEDVKAFEPYKRQSREQACDMAVYLFNNKGNIALAEELVRFAEDQFVIWEKPIPIIVKNNVPDPENVRGWDSKNWITPSVQEQYGFFMPVNRTAAIMIETYWAAYTATKKEIYLAKAKSIANAITLVQKEHDGDYPTMFTKYKMNFWLNSVVYPAKTMMKLEKNLQQLKK
ncbi:MAG: hypothetical protein VB102_13155 [Paludibacter sp.]|nr:hypothetical protein [Paludibacter sp.]